MAATATSGSHLRPHYEVTIVDELGMSENSLWSTQRCICLCEVSRSPVQTEGACSQEKQPQPVQRKTTLQAAHGGKAMCVHRDHHEHASRPQGSRNLFDLAVPGQQGWLTTFLLSFSRTLFQARAPKESPKNWPQPSKMLFMELLKAISASGVGKGGRWESSSVKGRRGCHISEVH